MYQERPYIYCHRRWPFAKVLKISIRLNIIFKATRLIYLLSLHWYTSWSDKVGLGLQFYDYFLGLNDARESGPLRANAAPMVKPAEKAKANTTSADNAYEDDSGSRGTSFAYLRLTHAYIGTEVPASEFIRTLLEKHDLPFPGNNMRRSRTHSIHQFKRPNVPALRSGNKLYYIICCWSSTLLYPQHHRISHAQTGIERGQKRLLLRVCQILVLHFLLLFAIFARLTPIRCIDLVSMLLLNFRMLQPYLIGRLLCGLETAVQT